MFKIKIIFFITILLFVSSCTPEPGFDWIVGNWQRTNDKEGNQTFETWIKVNDTEYQGMGITINGSDTIFQEHIVLRQTTTPNWNFEVTGVADSLPTIFKFSKSGTQSVTFKNMENEFPTHIQYKKEGNQLKALIWAGEDKVEFEFEKR